MLKKRFLLLLLSFLLGTIFELVPVAAAGTEYKLSSSINLSDNYTTSVRTIIDISNIDKLPSTLNLPAYGTNIRGLEASFADQKPITVSEEGGQLSLLIAQAQASAADKQSIAVSYSSNLGVRFGESFLIMIPPTIYADLNVVSESISINSDLELGPPVPRGSRPRNTSISVGAQVNEWSDSDGPLTVPVGLLFGDSAVAKATYSKTLENSSSWWRTESFVLPPDTNQQRVFIDSITPQPSTVTLDQDGNVIVQYRLGPRQQVDVTAAITILVNSYTYSLDSNLKTNDIDQSLIDRYTPLNGAWQDTPVDIAGADDLSVSDLIREVYKGVAEEYERVENTQWYDSALQRSNALIGELRANNIPSRLVVGAVFGDGGTVLSSPIKHAWAEGYIPNVGWITLDPSFEQAGSYFGVADVQRIGMALRGFDPEYPPGNISDFSINFSDEEAPTIQSTEPQIRAKKHVIFPGVAFETVSVTMPAGVIIDDAGLVVGGDELNVLGSLAPFQTVNVRSFDYLAEAFTSESVQYGIFEDGNIEGGIILAQASVEVSYLPMLGLALLIVLAILLRKLVPRTIGAIREKLANRKRRTKKTKDALVIATDKEGESIENIDMLSAPKNELNDQANIPKTQEAKNTADTDSTVEDANPDQGIALEQAHKIPPKEVHREVRRKRPPLIQ